MSDLPTSGAGLPDWQDYLFGTDGRGGIFSRSICTVRVERFDDECVRLLDAYLCIFHGPAIGIGERWV